MRKLEGSAKHIALILADTKAELRGDLLIQVADYLHVAGQNYTATKIMEIAENYNRMESEELEEWLKLINSD
jgi:hypothetical protein